MERGVVFSVCELLENNDGKGFRIGRWINPLELNYLALYWDRLVAPTNNFLHTAMKDEDELISCGLLTRPSYRSYGELNSDNMPAFQADIHAKTIDILRHQDGDVDWRMHFLNDQINIKPELSRHSEAIRFELANLLPVPTTDIKLHEILEFKERRKPELTALHEYLDELYLAVKRSGDFNLQRAQTLSNLKKAIADIDKLNQEGWRSPVKFSISTSFEFNLTQAFTGLASAALAVSGSHPYDILGGVGSVMSVLGGCIKITPQFQTVLASGNSKLAYISKGKNEGIIH